MELTTKQRLFLEYLLKRLGFQDDDFQKEFSNILEEKAYLYRHLSRIDLKEAQNGTVDLKYHSISDGQGYYKDNYSIVDLLVWEVNHRKNGSFVRKNLKGYVTATEIANYVYCPVGFSLSTTFELPPNLLAQIGSDFHEKEFLLNFLNQSRGNFSNAGGQLKKIREQNLPFFNEVESSSLLYSSHSSEEILTGVNGMFQGKPDYILRNQQNQLFIIEEKFRPMNGSRGFYENHIIQLLSYMFFLDPKNFPFGYLVYWYYDSNKGNRIEGCEVLKLYRNEANKEKILEYINPIESLRKSGRSNFRNDEISAVKCANCVHLPVCGHKNGRLDYFNYPYSPEHHKLYYAEFPDKLSKY